MVFWAPDVGSILQDILPTALLRMILQACLGKHLRGLWYGSSRLDRPRKEGDAGIPLCHLLLRQPRLINVGTYLQQVPDSGLRIAHHTRHLGLWVPCRSPSGCTLRVQGLEKRAFGISMQGFHIMVWVSLPYFGVLGRFGELEPVLGSPCR